MRITAIGQVAGATPFEWRFREIDWNGTQFEQAYIPQIDEVQQSTQLADGDVTYQSPALGFADAPVGFGLAIEGSYWKTATPANQLLAIDALAQIMNPTLNDAVDTQCLACHVATYLTTYRTGELMVDPATSPSWYRSARNTNVGMLGNSDGNQIRGFGYVGTAPIVSQRVANDTAHALDDVDALFPAR